MMKFSNPGMLVAIAKADAFGAAAEYLTLPRDASVRDKCLTFHGYIKHPTHGISAGTYTDDTEMSVANAHVLLEYNLPYAPWMFADAYVGEFNRGGRRDGYARNFQKFLERINSGEEFLQLIKPYSMRNGAAMRSVPFGVLRRVDDVLAVAELQASITHRTREGIFSSRAVALMSHFTLYCTEPMNMLGAYCMEYLPSEDVNAYGHMFQSRWPEGLRVHEEPYGCTALTTVHAVFDLLTHQNSLMNMLRQAILWGGDVDSVAAITWGIASARYQNEVLPLFMERDLENGNPATGVCYLTDIGIRLMNKFNFV